MDSSDFLKKLDKERQPNKTYMYNRLANITAIESLIAHISKGRIEKEEKELSDLLAEKATAKEANQVSQGTLKLEDIVVDDGEKTLDGQNKDVDER